MSAIARLRAFDTAISRSSRPSASPESIDLAASAHAFLQILGLAGDDQRRGRIEERDVAEGALLALEHVEQRRRVVPRHRRRASASGFDARKADILRLDLEGADLAVLQRRDVVGPEVVISSSPSEPCTTQTHSEPRFFSTCASGSTHCRENTPTICRFDAAGLDSGPSRLKIVRVPSSTRVGPTFFIAG